MDMGREGRMESRYFFSQQQNEVGREKKEKWAGLVVNGGQNLAHSTKSKSYRYSLPDITQLSLLQCHRSAAWVRQNGVVASAVLQEFLQTQLDCVSKNQPCDRLCSNNFKKSNQILTIFGRKNRYLIILRTHTILFSWYVEASSKTRKCMFNTVSAKFRNGLGGSQEVRPAGAD